MYGSEGYRLVAGRVIRESYGALKQQHTFTVEVLWSSGTRPKKPLESILIKGRNLYRPIAGRTVRRRPWADETRRRYVLEEKHRRGAAAREERDVRVVRDERPEGF